MNVPKALGFNVWLRLMGPISAFVRYPRGIQEVQGSPKKVSLRIVVVVIVVLFPVFHYQCLAQREGLGTFSTKVRTSDEKKTGMA